MQGTFDSMNLPIMPADLWLGSLRTIIVVCSFPAKTDSLIAASSRDGHLVFALVVDAKKNSHAIPCAKACYVATLCGAAYQ
jgi:hypothetical protein